jgi:hypothetical protein
MRRGLPHGPLLPTKHQVHLTLEPTLGLFDNFALVRRLARSAAHVCARVMAVAIRLGFVAEFSFEKTAYKENSRRVELRSILDREFTHWQLVLNPVFERVLHGPGTERGSNFEPALLVRRKRPAFSPSLEY